MRIFSGFIQAWRFCKLKGTVMITAEEKKEIINQFGKNEKDTGCVQAQVAILTRRIENLKVHFKENRHDYHSNRGLLKMIGKRKSLLNYLSRKKPAEYTDLIKALGLRK